MSVVGFILRGSKKQATRALSTIARRVAIVTVAISVAVMVVAFAVVAGYRAKLEDSLKTIMGDYKLSGRSQEARWVEESFEFDAQLVEQIMSVEGVAKVEGVVQSGGVLRFGGSMRGVAVVGVDSCALVGRIGGKMVQKSDNFVFDQSVFLSKGVVEKLGAQLGDQVTILFFKDSPIALTLNIAGIYDTHLAEIDDAIAWVGADKLAQISGYQANFIDHYLITANEDANHDLLAQNLDEFSSQTIVLLSAQQQYEHIYDWVNILDNNIALLMIILSIVVGVNIISVVLIVILENTMSIGVLKSLGMKNSDLMWIYGLKTIKVTFKGVLLGLVLGLAFCFVQGYWGVIELDPASYLVDSVPIKIVWGEIVAVFVGAMGVSLIFAILPTFIISKISPDKTLKFE